MSSKILLTGATGYIGSHCAVDMIQAGFDVVIFDNLSNSSSGVLDGIAKITGIRPDFIHGDMRNREDLEGVFSNHEFNSVIHFAGLKAVGESCEKPFLYYENNVVGTLNLVKVMEKHQVKDIVFSSSATVYDSFRSEPLFVETDHLLPTNPYGSTKYMIEQMLRDMSSYHGFRTISLRYFNPIGAHASGCIGEEPWGIPNNLLPYILDVARGKESSLTVYGDDYDTKDGTGVRDYLHVMDLVEAHRSALDYLTSKPQGWDDVFNLGTGAGTSVLEMISIVEEVTGKKIPSSIGPRRAGDIGVALSDPTKAHNLLGWHTTRSVGQAVEDAWKFTTKNL